jgi:hypothetical protein
MISSSDEARVSVSTRSLPTADEYRHAAMSH